MIMKPAVKKQFFEGHTKERLARWAEAGGVKQFASLSHTERAERLSRQKGDHVVHAVLMHLGNYSKKDLAAIATSMQIDLAGLRSSERIEQAIRDCLNGQPPKQRTASSAITSQDIWKEARRLSMPVLHLKVVRHPT